MAHYIPALERTLDEVEQMINTMQPGDVQMYNQAAGRLSTPAFMSKLKAISTRFPDKAVPVNNRRNALIEQLKAKLEGGSAVRDGNTDDGSSGAQAQQRDVQTQQRVQGQGVALTHDVVQAIQAVLKVDGLLSQAEAVNGRIAPNSLGMIVREVNNVFKFYENKFDAKFAGHPQYDQAANVLTTLRARVEAISGQPSANVATSNTASVSTGSKPANPPTNLPYNVKQAIESIQAANRALDKLTPADIVSGKLKTVERTVKNTMRVERDMDVSKYGGNPEFDAAFELFQGLQDKLASKKALELTPQQLEIVKNFKTRLSDLMLNFTKHRDRYIEEDYVGTYENNLNAILNEAESVMIHPDMVHAATIISQAKGCLDDAQSKGAEMRRLRDLSSSCNAQLDPIKKIFPRDLRFRLQYEMHNPEDLTKYIKQLKAYREARIQFNPTMESIRNNADLQNMKSIKDYTKFWFIDNAGIPDDNFEPDLLHQWQHETNNIYTYDTLNFYSVYTPKQVERIITQNLERVEKLKLADTWAREMNGELDNPYGRIVNTIDEINEGVRQLHRDVTNETRLGDPAEDQSAYDEVMEAIKLRGYKVDNFIRSHMVSPVRRSAYRNTEKVNAKTTSGIKLKLEKEVKELCDECSLQSIEKTDESHTGFGLVSYVMIKYIQGGETYALNTWMIRQRNVYPILEENIDAPKIPRTSGIRNT